MAARPTSVRLAVRTEAAVVVAITLLFYELMRGRTLAESMARVRSYDHELSMWRLWERGVSPAAA